MYSFAHLSRLLLLLRPRLLFQSQSALTALTGLRLSKLWVRLGPKLTFLGLFDGVLGLLRLLLLGVLGLLLGDFEELRAGD